MCDKSLGNSYLHSPYVLAGVVYPRIKLKHMNNYQLLLDAIATLPVSEQETVCKLLAKAKANLKKQAIKRQGVVDLINKYREQA